MTVPPELEAWWKYIVTGAAFFAFVLRMEARISAAHAKIEVMQKQRDEDRKESDRVRAEIKEAIADLYREMKSEMQTIQQDIKQLLRENGK